MQRAGSRGEAGEHLTAEGFGPLDLIAADVVQIDLVEAHIQIALDGLLVCSKIANFSKTICLPIAKTFGNNLVKTLSTKFKSFKKKLFSGI